MNNNEFKDKYINFLKKYLENDYKKDFDKFYQLLLYELGEDYINNYINQFYNGNSDEFKNLVQKEYSALFEFNKDLSKIFEPYSDFNSIIQKFEEINDKLEKSESFQMIYTKYDYLSSKYNIIEDLISHELFKKLNDLNILNEYLNENVYYILPFITDELFCKLSDKQIKKILIDIDPKFIIELSTKKMQHILNKIDEKCKYDLLKKIGPDNITKELVNIYVVNGVFGTPGAFDMNKNLKNSFKLLNSIYDNLDYFDCLQFAYRNNNFDYCNSYLLSFMYLPIKNASKENKSIELFLDIYKNNSEIVCFLNFLNKYQNSSWVHYFVSHIKSLDDIGKYFNENGSVNDEFYDLYFEANKGRNRYGRLFAKFLNENYNIVDHYKDDKAVLRFFENINYLPDKIKNIDSRTSIYQYFNKDGSLTDEAYDVILIDEKYIKYWNIEKHFESDSILTSFINYRKNISINFNSFIVNKNDIYLYFDEFGPKKIFYDYYIFKSDMDYIRILNHDFEYIKNMYGSNILFYIEFIKKYGKIFSFINEDNYLKYFNSDGIRLELQNYLKDNPNYTKQLLGDLVHNNQVINNLDFEFVSLFEYYIIDNFFNNIDNAKEKYDYLLNNLGPQILFNLDNENVLKLINLDDVTLKKFMDTIKCCSYTDVPKNVLYNNISISLCNYVFKKEFSSTVNIFTNIKSIILRMSDKEIVDCFNGVCDNNLQRSLISDIYSLINFIDCSKEELYKAIIECKNLNEDDLHTLCRKYLEKSEENYLEENKDIILNKFGIPLSYDRDDSIKKISTYYKTNIDFDMFNSYRYVILLMKSKNWNDLKNNEFIDSLNMTKSEYNIILSITEEEFNLIVSAIREKRKPDETIKDKFKLFNRFINLFSGYKFDNEKIDYILQLVNAKRICNLELKDIDMFQVLKEMDIDIFINEVINNEKVMYNLKNVMKNKFIGRLPEVIGDEFKGFYNLDLPDGINNIGLFLTKYSQILDRKRIILKSQGIDIDVSKINLSFSEIIEDISAVNSATEEVKRLFESREYSDFVANPTPNKNNYNRKLREEKLVRVADYLYSVSSVTIPSKDFIIENQDKSKNINFIVGNRTNPSNICHGERTGACMRIGGVGEGLFLKCITDKNWFHIRIEDPETHEYISRVSGFRKGNSVFLNQLRDSCNVSKYSNNDLQELITIYANQLIDETKNSKYPIENVFINTEYAMIGYNSSNVYKLGSQIQDCYNLDDVKDLELSSYDIWTDVHNNAYLLATTEDKKNKDGYVTLKGGPEDTCVYDAIRDKIYGLAYDESTIKHQFVSVNSEVLIEKINRVHAMKEKLLGKDYRYEISDLIFDSSKIIDGYASSDFYVYIDSNYNIHSDYIENINKDGNIIPYDQSAQAKNEMNNYIEVIKNRYNLMEVKHAI